MTFAHEPSRRDRARPDAPPNLSGTKKPREMGLNPPLAGVGVITSSA